MLSFTNASPQYRTKSTMNFSWLTTSTYGSLLQKFDPDLMMKIVHKNQMLMSEKIYIVQVNMHPQNMHWVIWKNKDEIFAFLKKFNVQMNAMGEHAERMFSTGQQIMQKYQYLSNCMMTSNQDISRFIEWLNMVGDHSFLRKAIPFLIFIEHCVSIDKWNILIYQQLYVFKAKSTFSKMTNFFSQDTSQTENIDYFLTVTTDGILKSDNHLLLSRVKKMVPFTNQITVDVNFNSDNDLVYTIQSGRTEKLDVNFHSDYISGINFGCGLNSALINSSFKLPHRFGSYSQQRKSCASKFYNDGAGYYEDLFTELMRAQKQVCITGWMITPYFLLRRPNSIEHKEFRLDGVLQKLALRGVQIYIIAFMEPAMFVNNDSEFVQLHLQALHKNIKVLRHPNNAIPLLWSHHEKMVIVDQKIAFMGGLDICYGRWDTPQHYLNDPGLLWDGADYNNYRTKDIYQPRNYKVSNLNKNFQPRMPWHDIALQIRGDCVIDLLRHFVQYWYFVRSELEMDPMRMVNNFKKRINMAANHVEKDQMQYYRKFIKKESEQSLSNKFAAYKKKIAVFVSGEEQRLAELFISQRTGFNAGRENIQLCRSASQWSIGVLPNKQEYSIHNAYLDLIQNSQRFIYIQNQFFMGLENKVVQTLARRIARAHSRRENYKVIIVMPLLPGFQGDIGNPASTVLRIQVHHEYQAIIRGQKSIYSRLANIPNVNDYIFFFGLRTSQLINNVAMTEIIYVHSKLMIVDDHRTIIGSANINDRSLLGTRDSEIAAVIEEDQGDTNALNLRIRLFQEHFQLSPQDSVNIMNPQVWNRVIENAKRNTLMYRDTFGCIPDDTVTVASEIQKLKEKSNIQRFNDLKRYVVGHAVQFPLYFMKDEDLTFKPSQKQFYAPDSSFT